ncbi:MAG: MFS transporter, partial [Chloroflexi bacterium]|nr:MFS transporter [Chloroflexota bacterium]
FGAVAITLLVHAISSSALAVAFPQITSSLGVSIVLAGWVLTVFQLATIVSIPVAAKASDTLGRKRTFMVVVIVFTVGSLLSAIAPNIYWLILARAIQGAGAGGFMTSATGIIADTYPEQRHRYIGLITSIVTAGMVVGPYIGGWLTESFGWRAVFWAAAPWGLVAIIGAAVLVKPDSTSQKAAFDLKGAAILACALAALMIGLTSFGEGVDGTSWVVAGLSLAAGLALVGVFVRHERRASSPMIDMELIRGKSFLAANTFNLVFGLTTGAFILLPLYAVSVYGVSTLASGLIVTPRAAAMMGVSIVVSFMLVRWGYRKPMLIGSAIMIVATFLLALELDKVVLPWVTISGFGVMLVVMALSGLGQGFIMPAANNACIELMPDKVSTIAGLRQNFRQVGHALGISIATIVLDHAGSLPRGFAIFFFGMAVLAVVSLPCIFAMPRSPSDTRPELVHAPARGEAQNEKLITPSRL